MNFLWHMGRLANGVTRALDPNAHRSASAPTAGAECTPCAANAYAEQTAADVARMLGRSGSSSGRGGRGRGNGRGAR